jgi:hypothetical protein
MNTVSDDTADAKAKITGYFWGYGCFQGCAPPEAQWKWFVGLQPSLEMGLDFDMSGTLDVQVPIETRIPFPMATVSGALYHDAYDEAAGKWKATVLASLAPSEPTNLDANTPHLFSWQVSPAAAADLVPYAKRAYLTLMLNLTTPKAGLFTGAEAPMLDPGGVMKLPLFEYRDPVSQALQSVGAVRLEPLGARERAVNPGKAAVFAVRLVNDLDRDQDFDLNVTGIHAGWSRLLGPDAVHVAARSAAEIRLGVRVPADAADRDAADLVLSAEDPANPSVRSLIRLLAVVDVGHPQPDDAAQMDAYQPETAHDSPALPAMLAVLALAAGARLAGSRRASGPPRMGLK